MKLCYVVQRYGEAVAGGAEQHCREMAERMAARGHEVEVATTCAESYIDWADVYPPGESLLNGVVVHRFPVTVTRDYPRFDEINRRCVTGPGLRPLSLQREWMRMQGPLAPGVPAWLAQHAPRFDCVIVFTYLYWTAWSALAVVPGVAPVVLHPTVHDEPALKLSIFDGVFRAPDAFALSTPEEIDLIRRRFRFDPPGAVIGIGVDLPAAGVDGAAFRRAHALGDAPYLLYTGRVVEGKGCGELIDFFIEYKNRHPSGLTLAMVGDAIMDVPARDDIVVTGFVDYGMRDSALAGAHALVMPSFFESFSMVVIEAFAHARPALVQGHCAVLRGQAHRSGAAIPYAGFAEFECAVELLHDDPALANSMGAAGRAFVEREYTWAVVLDRYEYLLERVVSEHTNRTVSSG